MVSMKLSELLLLGWWVERLQLPIAREYKVVAVPASRFFICIGDLVSG